MNQALLWVAAVPLAKDDLRERRPADYNTRRCPQIHLGIGPRGSSGQRSLRIRLAVAVVMGYMTMIGNLSN